MSIFHMSLPLQTPQNLSISSSSFLSGQTLLTLTPKFSHLSLTSTTKSSTIIRMGGGPRTFPGGVNKWQWKRMQAKKAKQLLKARLARERQIYEMRKRAELKTAVSELERPWEVVEKAPKLFSVSADEQVQVLADRFQKPGGFDLWSEKDGPELFKTVDGFPSARFFPKGVVHSIRPYGRVNDEIDEFEGLGNGLGDEKGVKIESFKEYVKKRNVSNEGRSGEGGKGKVRKKRHGRSVRGLDSSDVNDGVGISRVGYRGENSGRSRVVKKDGSYGGGIHPQELRGENSEFYDMNLRDMNNGVDSRRVGFDGKNSERTQVVKKDGSLSRRIHPQELRGENSQVYDMNNGLDSRTVGFNGKNSGRPRVVKKDGSFSKGMRLMKVEGANSEVYNMDLRCDGSYWFKEENE